jgi:glycosyltransferase involved in cell wall biosynthesis
MSKQTNIHIPISKTMPLVSVVMSAYNAEKWILQSIHSILRQTYTNFEFLIINDGSSDHTLDLIKTEAEKDSRIRIFDNHKNIGIAEAANIGLNHARGEFIARMDADDISFPCRFEKLVHVLLSENNVICVGGYAEQINENGEHIGIMKPLLNSTEINTSLLFDSCFINSTVIFRKSSFLQTGMYRKEYSGVEDYDYWQRLAHFGQLKNIPFLLGKYRWHKSNISNSKNTLMAKLTCQLSYHRIVDELHNSIDFDSYKSFWLYWKRNIGPIRISDIKKLMPLWDFAASLPMGTEILGREWLSLSLRMIRQKHIMAGLYFQLIIRQKFGISVLEKNGIFLNKTKNNHA